MKKFLLLLFFAVFFGFYYKFRGLCFLKKGLVVVRIDRFFGGVFKNGGSVFFSNRFGVVGFSNNMKETSGR